MSDTAFLFMVVRFARYVKKKRKKILQQAAKKKKKKKTFVPLTENGHPQCIVKHEKTSCRKLVPMVNVIVADESLSISHSPCLSVLNEAQSPAIWFPPM